MPDADVLYSFFGGKVNYLLQHRGHSHTIVGVLLLAAAALGIARWRLAKRDRQPSARDLAWLAGIFVITPLLHIGMDFTNNYGVHPFWPFYNGWIYGDAVFIAEPLFWAACAPLAFTLRTRTARLLVAAVLVFGVALSFFSGFVALIAAIVLTFTTAAMLLLARRAAPRVSLTTGVALWLIVTAIFVISSHVAARRVDSFAATLFPEARLLDRVLTPMPANPLCWEVMLVQAQGASVAARRGEASDDRTRAFADRRRRLSQPQHGYSDERAIGPGERCRYRSVAVVRRDRDLRGPSGSTGSDGLRGCGRHALPTAIARSPSLSAGHRLRDLADVQDLIVTLALPLDLAESLDASVREEYRRLWNLARHAGGPS